MKNNSSFSPLQPQLTGGSTPKMKNKAPTGYPKRCSRMPGPSQATAKSYPLNTMA